MTSILVGNLPDLKKLIEDNVVGWVGKPHDITQFFEELKTTNCLCLINQSLYKKRNEALETIQNPLMLFINPKPLLIHFKMFADVVNDQDIEN